LAQKNIKIVKSVKNQTFLSIDVNQNFEEYDDPLQQFTYALRATETKRQYPRRLKVFMDFFKLERDIRQQAKTLKEKNQNDNNWFRTSIIQFFEFQKERARRNDIAFPTISNY
jgi:hypothetical protein